MKSVFNREDGELLQEPFTLSVNAHDWRRKGTEIAYVVKNIPSMVSLVRLNPETKQILSVILRDEYEELGDGRFRLTFRLRNALAVYSQEELDFIKAFSPQVFESRLVRVISVDEARELDGKVYTPGATASIGDL